MAKNKVTVTDNSIKSGVTNDVKKAICEYIWNGFDAHAKNVSILYTANEIGTVLSLVIKDDGEGINRSTLSDTFGRYQDSVKTKSFQWSSQVKGHKGKGRYAFNRFADRAEWTTIYKDGNNLLKYNITISGDDNDHYNDHADDGRLQIVYNVSTGTEVRFVNINQDVAFFESENFINYLQKEFAVFLKLNESKDYSLTINGYAVDYNTVIADSDTKEIVINDAKENKNYCFHVTFIRWHEKMKENYCVYYLNQDGIERYEETTRLNKKDTDFHHSVYVSSDYFEYFSFMENGEDENLPKFDFTEFHPLKNERDRVFKDLRKEIFKWLSEKQQMFILEIGGQDLWCKYEKNGVVKPPKNEYERPLYDELRDTVIGIYSVQPKIFQNLKNDQAKALVGCVKSLLQTDKRNDILTILDSITKMSDEECHRLAQILKTTELANITRTIEMLENRLKVISALKAMVFDKSINAYEVNDIQKIVGNAFWIFGEQYNVVTEAEPDFQQALESYLVKIHKEKDGISKSAINIEKIQHPDVNKEMDIFAFRQNQISQTIENIVIELKRPTVKLGEVEVSQVKTYMRLIYSEPRFNSPNSTWTFILVGNDFDNSGYIENEINSNKTWGRKNLIQHVSNERQNYEIYVKKWSSIFDDFEIRHKFILDKLNFKRKELIAKYNTKEDLHKIVTNTVEVSLGN